MPKNSLRGSILHILLGPAWVAAFLWLPGCQANLPMIELQPVSNPIIGPQHPPGTLKAGHFTSSQPEYDAHAQYARLYLDQKLSSTSSSSLPAGPQEPTPHLVQGRISLRNVDLPKSPHQTGVRIEITFEITQPQTRRIIQSATLANYAPKNNPDDIRRALRDLVDSFVADIFTPQAPLAGSMARGWTEYDRQGRKLAAQGDYPAAFSLFRQAVDARPDDHAALYNAALVLEAMGQYDRARKYYRRALKLADRDEYKISCLRLERRLKTNPSTLNENI